MASLERAAHRQGGLGRRSLLRWVLGAPALWLRPRSAAAQPRPSLEPHLARPIWVYNNWSAYDELSDEVPLNESLALKELAELRRLSDAGVHFDYYMMDAFWYEPDGGYRLWRRQDWPEGPDRWIRGCEAAGIKPGLWFGTNTLVHLNPVSRWRGSLTANGNSLALYAGGFLADFMDVLETWYGRGLRMFKLDFADFTAAAKGDETRLPLPEIRLRNGRALHAALRDFRVRHPDIVLVAFNGFVGDVESPALPLSPFNTQWLDAFDSLYTGDPRPSDLPEMDLWRAVDIYSDDMVRHFAQNGLPLQRADSTAFMLGNTGTNYFRGTNAWRGSLLLMVARGGWINTVHGNLEFLGDADAGWFARVQALYAPLQAAGTTRWFGGNPGDVRPYGFGSTSGRSSLYAVVNPAQGIGTLRLRRLVPEQPANVNGRVLFHDAGFEPTLDGDMIRLGPGQLALVGFGRYADAAYDLGVESDIRVPRRIEPLPAHFREMSGGDAHAPEPTAAIRAKVEPPASGDLRIVLQQRDLDGSPVRSVSHRKMGSVFVIAVSQGGKDLPVEIRYDTVIWSGLSWAVGEVRREHIAAGAPLSIRLSTTEPDPDLHLEGRVYNVIY